MAHLIHFHATTCQSPTPIGSEAANAILMLVTSSDGITPVSGATLEWSANNAAGLSACNGASTCYAYTDESRQAETRVMVGSVGTTNISATLAPDSYTPAKLVQAAVSGTSSAKDPVLLAPKVWVVQGATTDVPFTARLLANSVPVSGQTLKWQVGIGSGIPGSTTTDGNGYARSTIHVASITSDVQGTSAWRPPTILARPSTSCKSRLLFLDCSRWPAARS